MRRRRCRRIHLRRPCGRRRSTAVAVRSRKWGPDPGFMSNRGLVRRRRWIRLMMRPAQARHNDLDSLVSTPGALSVLPELPHIEEGATRPPSVLLTALDEDEGTVDVWRGDEGDWDRCHLALRHLNRDGRKLELWATWLGVPEGVAVSRRSSRVPSTFLHQAAGQSSMDRRDEDISEQTEADRLTADTGARTSKAHRSFIIPVVRAHVSRCRGLSGSSSLTLWIIGIGSIGHVRIPGFAGQVSATSGASWAACRATSWNGGIRERTRIGLLELYPGPRRHCRLAFNFMIGPL